MLVYGDCWFMVMFMVIVGDGYVGLYFYCLVAKTWLVGDGYDWLSCLLLGLVAQNFACYCLVAKNLACWYGYSHGPISINPTLSTWLVC